MDDSQFADNRRKGSYRYIATLSRLTEWNISGFYFKAFPVPTAILLGVAGVTRSPAVMLDLENGYFDRLPLTPSRRLSILLGHARRTPHREHHPHRRCHGPYHSVRRLRCFHKYAFVRMSTIVRNEPGSTNTAAQILLPAPEIRYPT